MATCRGCLAEVCAVCDMAESVCRFTDCGRGIFVRVEGLHCRFCLTTIHEYDDHDDDDETDDYTDSDEGFHEEDVADFLPAPEPHIVSLFIYFLIYIL